MHESRLSGEPGFAGAVIEFYCPLIALATKGPDADAEPSLGGRLLYAGLLDDERCRALLVAANIAGAASLAASGDADAQRQAIRDGVVDFAVTNLDEALRILKNEVRKREAVAVCVGAAPETVESEMRERGVAPDLIAGWVGHSVDSAAITARARRIGPVPADDGCAQLTWSVATAPAQWLPRLDRVALDCLDADAWVERRWMRLAPRFLGRLARGTHALRCEVTAAQEFVERIDRAFLRGEMDVPVEVAVMRRGIAETHRFAPAGRMKR
jgi:hypothetical protein